MSVLTPNMNLIQSTVGVDSGLAWEQNLNASLATIDGHNHSPGFGVPINPSGLNINSDLLFNNNNATALRSVRFQSQGSPLAGGSDLGCLYESGADLWFNDANGNQIQITTGGAVNVTSSGISSGTATASFVSSVLVVNAAPLTPANIQAGSILLGNNIANSKFLTLSPPSAMAANFSITLPSLPAATSVLTLDTSGNISTTSVNQFVPVGATIPFAGPSTPSGYLLADGSAVSRTTYAALFAIIGTTFGPGDGSTTFNLPDATNLLAFKSANTPIYVHSEWPLNEANGNALNALQPSGTYNLTQQGTVGALSGLFGGARGIFNTPDFFKWPALGSSATVYDAQNFIVEGWFNTTVTGYGDIAVMAAKASQTGGSLAGWLLAFNTPNGNIIFVVNTSPSTQTIITSNDSATIFGDGNWHYLVAGKLSTSGGSNIRMYLDNVLQTDQATGVTMLPSTNDLHLGANVAGTSFGGYLESWAYWNTVPGSWATVESIINTRWNGGAGGNYAASVPINYIIKT